MERLPVDIIADILSRLPVKSVMRCRCVSKPWLNLTLDPRFVQTHLDRSSLQRNPNFILTSGICINFTNFLSVMHFLQYDETRCDYNCADVCFSQPNFLEFRVRGSSNGLLCLVHPMNPYAIYVCNPFTRHFIKLPDCRFCNLSDEFLVGFGFSPKTNEYKTVVIREPLNKVYVCTLGDRVWRLVKSYPFSIKSQSFPATFVNGALHWASQGFVNAIVSVDIVDEVVRRIPWPEVGVGPEGNRLLGKLCDCLSFTQHLSEGRVEIWMMKDYGVMESWNKCFDIHFNRVGNNVYVSDVRTLCVGKDGEILMICSNRTIFSYDPQTMMLRKLNIVGLPSWFEATMHVGSLVSPKYWIQQ